MKKLLSSLAIVAATTTNVCAEDIDSGFYIFPSVGYFFLDNERDADNAPEATFAAGYQFNRRWSTEAAYGVFSSESNLTGKDIDGSYYHLDGLYFLNDDDVLQPYLVAGIGNMDLDIEGSDNDDETSYNAGAGFKRHLTEQLALRAEARMFYGNDSNAKDLLLNVGVVYLFGAGASSSYAEEVAYDSDGDGVLDRDDQCPNTPAGEEVDGQGCQVKVMMLDHDADGIEDSLDKCPNTPAGYPVDEKGCALDSDGDGIADGADQCPDTKAGAKVDAKGCYEKLKETVTQTLNVEFPNNSAVVPEAYKTEIAELAVFMRAYPESKVTIEGHTDDRGAAAYNQSLSEKRAEAIKAVLIEEHDIDAGRVDAVGYGEEKPIADNGTSAGRSKNRRVVAVISAELEK